MPTELTPDDHLAALAAAMRLGIDAAARAGLDAAVPTCPEWTVRQLIAHTGKVHRWAAAQLGDDEARARVGDGSAAEQDGLTTDDPLAWWSIGAHTLIEAIGSTPDDVEALVFLKDAPTPRRFWARRQCHETTIHAVDAVSAQLGRRPSAAEVSLGDNLALDGIDELVMGFLPRSKSRLRSDRPQRLWLRPEGEAVPSWTIDIGLEPPVSNKLGPSVEPDADVELTGSPVGMYLTLWNRADELDGDEATLRRWAELAQVTW